MEIGIFQLLPAPENLSDGDVIRQALWEVDFAEQSGFDAVWITEHHLSSFGLVGAPSVYAAAVAQRTTRIDLGYAVAVVPLHHPIRLAEEIAWLSHLSSGRVRVGVGPGFSAFEFAAYGVPLEDRYERLEEGTAVLRGLLAGGEFRHRGKYWSVPSVTLRPRPFEGAAPLFLHASSGEASLRAAAAAGEPVMLGLKSLNEIAERIALYRSIRESSGVTPAQIDREISRFRVLRRIVVAESDEEALSAARRALAWEEATSRRVHEGKAAPTLADGSHSAGGTEFPGACVGTPTTVRTALAGLGALGIRNVIAWLNFGNLPYASARRSMALLAEEVIPGLSSEGESTEAEEVAS
jgi:alkanesulfonate monooxygenase SsuD/methylene tetrahydromethanopterin reductase-like flavin-dependent oxidoreductase (luciferase family)